jgi:hypothetical protein
MNRVAVPLAIVAMASLVALAGFELVLRAIGYSEPAWYRPDPVLGWKLRPRLEAWYTREGRAFVRVNAAGMRDRDHALEKPAGVYRIAVLGDSYAEARHVAAEQTFWALLPERLEDCGFARGARVEVLNFGIAGYGTAQQYLLFESMAARYRPDLVLLQFTNGNDVRNNSRALEDEKARPFYALGRDGELSLDDSFVRSSDYARQASTLSELLRHAADYSRVLQLLRSVRNATLVQKANAAGNGVEQGLEAEVLAPPRERPWQEAWRVTEELIAMTQRAAERDGARFLLVTVPYAIQVHPDGQLRATLAKKLGVPELFYPDRRLAQFAFGRGIDMLALAPQMQPLAETRKAYFHGFENVGMGRGHWNPQGHGAAADLIAQHLCK